MIDTTSLKSLISAFRAETTKDSITPERLGSLLQKLADALEQCVTASDTKSATTLAENIKSVAKVITALSAGTANKKDVRLSYQYANPSTGASGNVPDAVVIPAASSDNAGAMTADHVAKLKELSDKAVTLVADTQSLLKQIQAEATQRQSADADLGNQLAQQAAVLKEEDKTLKERIAVLESNGNAQSKSIITLQTDNNNNKESLKELQEASTSHGKAISELQASDIENSNAIKDLQHDLTEVDKTATFATNSIDKNTKAITALQDDQASLKKDKYQHIEVTITDGFLIIHGAAALVEQGLIPLIFRYAVTQSRHKNKITGIRERLPKKKGWHVYCGKDHIKFIGDVLYIHKRDVKTQEPEDYLTTAGTLFKKFNKIEVEGKTLLKVAYGKKSYALSDEKIHKFKFAIAFASAYQANMTFSFTQLRTNLAVFNVQAKNQKNINIEYNFSR